MSHAARKVLEQALHLSQSERASVAGALIESLHAEAQEGVDEAWEQVIERRVRELEGGTAETFAWSEVRSQLFSRFE